MLFGKNKRTIANNTQKRIPPTKTKTTTKTTTTTAAAAAATTTTRHAHALLRLARLLVQARDGDVAALVVGGGVGADGELHAAVAPDLLEVVGTVLQQAASVLRAQQLHHQRHQALGGVLHDVLDGLLVYGCCC